MENCIFCNIIAGDIPSSKVYEDDQVLAFLDISQTVAMAYDLNYDEAMARATELLELFRLSDKLEWFPINFSKGMKQKVISHCNCF